MNTIATREMAAVFCARTDDTTREIVRPTWAKHPDGTKRHCRVLTDDVTDRPLFPESATVIDLAADFITRHEDDPIPETRPLHEVCPDMPAYSSSFANMLVAATSDEEATRILDEYEDKNSAYREPILAGSEAGPKPTYGEIAMATTATVGAWALLAANLYSQIR